MTSLALYRSGQVLIQILGDRKQIINTLSKEDLDLEGRLYQALVKLGWDAIPLLLETTRKNPDLSLDFDQLEKALAQLDPKKFEGRKEKIFSARTGINHTPRKTGYHSDSSRTDSYDLKGLGRGNNYSTPR